MAPRSSALAPVPGFLGGSCPLGCSLSAPATGGFSVVSTVLMYAAGSEEEKGVGGLLHGDTIAQVFVFCKGGWQWACAVAVGRRGGRMVLSWRAPSISGGVGLACAAIPPAPPSNVFRNRGTRCTPGGGWISQTGWLSWRRTRTASSFAMPTLRHLRLDRCDRRVYILG